jgi:raffinose/stachyose/melibiose transport system substrate-binding protein
MSPEGMNTFVGKQGGLPTLPDTGFTIDPSLTEVQKFITDERTVPFMDQLWPNPKVQQTLFSGMQEMLGGRSTPQKVLSAMDTDYKSGS